MSSTSSSSDAFILGNAGACSLYVTEQADNQINDVAGIAVDLQVTLAANLKMQFHPVCTVTPFGNCLSDLDLLSSRPTAAICP